MRSHRNRLETNKTHYSRMQLCQFQINVNSNAISRGGCVGEIWNFHKSTRPFDCGIIIWCHQHQTPDERKSSIYNCINFVCRIILDQSSQYPQQSAQCGRTAHSVPPHACMQECNNVVHWTFSSNNYMHRKSCSDANGTLRCPLRPINARVKNIMWCITVLLWIMFNRSRCVCVFVRNSK